MQFINVDFRPENSENITDYDAPKEHKNGIPLFLDSYLSFITTGLGWVHEAFDHLRVGLADHIQNSYSSSTALELRIFSL